MHTEVSVTRFCYLKQVDKKTNIEFSSVATSRPVMWHMIFLNEVFFWFPVKNRSIFLLSIPHCYFSNEINFLFIPRLLS